MFCIRSLKLPYGLAFVVVCVFSHRFSNAQESFRVSYGGYNETAAPMWVGIEKGIFKKYGIDASMIQSMPAATPSMERSLMRRATDFINSKCGILSK